ncbi:MAG: hypothetical protein JWO45_278 [Spartobacteria bacterium]|nr:hypothetical protein [Spartobacteria bacterium]
MRTISIYALGLASLCLGACDWAGIRGNGHIVTVQPKIESFSEIHTKGGFKVEWRSGPASLSITTDENLLPYIESHNSGNRLELRTRDRLRPTEGIMFVVSSPTLAGAKLSGASTLVAHSISGSTFFVESTGASEITLDGTVDELLADLTGASELKAKGLQAKVVELSTTGAGEAWVTVTDKLRVAITGAGDVTYSGNPKTVERHITGAGSVHIKD